MYPLLLKKIWFIQINGEKLGPFAIQDLKKDKRVTPDTWVWKEGFRDWVRLRDIPELQEIFKDEEESIPLDDKYKKLDSESPRVDNDILTLKYEPPNLVLWLMLLFIFIFFVLYTIKT